MLIGALIFALGAVFGRVMPGRKRGPKPPKPVQAICGCSHHYSLHEPKTGECHGATDAGRVAVRDQNSKPVKDRFGEVVFTREHGRCGCRRYTGPLPLPEYFAPEISNG
jgi:hypothetical protein